MILQNNKVLKYDLNMSSLIVAHKNGRENKIELFHREFSMQRKTELPDEQSRKSCHVDRCARKNLIRTSVHAWLEKKSYACTELQGVLSCEWSRVVSELKFDKSLK